MKTALTIAGADPSGGAGVQADLRAFEAFGVRGLSAITALTAQNDRAVAATLNIPPAFLERQVLTLLEEFTVDSVKIGMTGSRRTVLAIERLLRTQEFKNTVLDTVLVSSSGYPLLDRPGVAALKRLFPLVRVVTPNIPEASILTGIEINGTDDMEEAARRLHSMGAPCALIKGGHLKGDPVDILFDGKRFDYFRGKRIKGRKEKFHGTGCRLSAAMAAGLARGATVRKAVEDARRYLEGSLKGR